METFRKKELSDYTNFGTWNRLTGKDEEKSLAEMNRLVPEKKEWKRLAEREGK